uniref:AMP-dependent synthetase/ligase domain-containing protein n=1 Tax=Cajanus cajan TaxID=3821 RepID=A0A151QL14_CAJCA|nr:hypothetical protein KK1_049351 [Cajanus cajan]
MEQLKPGAANSSPLTPLGFLDRATTVYCNTPSVIYNQTTFTWSHTHVVSVVAPNIPAMYELHFAVPFVGALLNNNNTRLDARTVSVILRHASSTLVFVDYASRDLVLQALSLFPDNLKGEARRGSLEKLPNLNPKPQIQANLLPLRLDGRSGARRRAA